MTPQCKDGNARFTTVPLNAVSDQVWIKISMFKIIFKIMIMFKSDMIFTKTKWIEFSKRKFKISSKSVFFWLIKKHIAHWLIFSKLLLCFYYTRLVILCDQLFQKLLFIHLYLKAGQVSWPIIKYNFLSVRPLINIARPQCIGPISIKTHRPKVCRLQVKLDFTTTTKLQI